MIGSSPARIRTEVTRSKASYDWPLHHGAVYLCGTVSNLNRFGVVFRYDAVGARRGAKL